MGLFCISHQYSDLITNFAFLRTPRNLTLASVSLSLATHLISFDFPRIQSTVWVSQAEDEFTLSAG